jgi:hypothetical protein
MEAQTVDSMSLPMELIEFDVRGSIKIFDLGGTLKAAIDCGEIKSQVDYGGAMPQLDVRLMALRCLVVMLVGRSMDFT